MSAAVLRPTGRLPANPAAALAGMAILVLTASGLAHGADATDAPLAPIRTAGSDDLVDPMRPTSLTAEQRDRLYEQVAREAEHLERHSQQLRRLARLLQPAVVHIDARKPALRPRNGRAADDETGSGVIVEIADRTVVLTNRHVIDRAPLDSITIRLDDRRELRPRRLWSDLPTDLAVMEIEAPHLVTARLAPPDAVDIGDTVIALGSPFGLSRSMTLGIVSGLGRRDLQLEGNTVKFQDFIQSDAAINPGNSGGPLVNLRGEVVGINTCIASNSGGFEGLGFAIPVGMVTFVARQLVERGTVSRGFIGVQLDEAFTQADAHRLGMERPIGARIAGVTPESPADLAGLRRDDIVLEFDGRAVEDDDHLMSIVSTTPADSPVTVTIFRDRARLPVQLTVASRDRFAER